MVLEAYSVGKALHDAGVVRRMQIWLRFAVTLFHLICLEAVTRPRALQISALDMTCEAVVTKMAYLLSLNASLLTLQSPFFC